MYTNQTLSEETGFLGTFPAEKTSFTFSLPVHPVWEIQAIYNQDGLRPLSWNFDRERGTVQVEIMTERIPEWSSALVFVDYTPGLAIYYETAPGGTSRVLTEVELNPAFAGLANGYVYLQHKAWTPKFLSLQVDKPRIPYVHATDPEDVEFGPVEQGDYAVLTVTALGANETELVAGARLLVRPGEDFEGSVNYKNPAEEDVWLTTGADGTASLLFTPGQSYGFYVPTASVNSGTLELPAAVPLHRVLNNKGQISARLYLVANDDPYLGKVGAEPKLGEIAWATQGTPGQEDYRTNGRRVLWRSDDGQPKVPSDLQDASGNSYKSANFSGSVAYIIFSEAIPTGSRIGAYFLAFTGKVTLRVTSPDYNVVSNPITLRVVPPEEITELSVVDESLWQPIAGYLMLNDFAEGTGRLNVNRLTGGPLLQLRFRKRI